MKYTLLDLTQQVLSSIDGDEVNSINDTVESKQVAAIVKRCYTDLLEEIDYPEKYTLFGLTSSSDSDKPTLMTLPTGTALNVIWLKYDNKASGDTDTNFQDVNFLELNEFFRRMHALVPSQDDSLDTFTHTVNDQDIQFIIRTDKAPQWYTTWDDKTFVFDSYDSDVDTILQSSKTLAYGRSAPTWSATDDFIPEIDNHQLLLNSSIALAWAEMKQAANAKAERQIRKGLVSTARNKHAIDPIENYQAMTPNYGRK